MSKSMIDSKELLKFLQEELDFEIKQLGHSFEKDELINLGASIYTLKKVIDKVEGLVEENDGE